MTGCVRTHTTPEKAKESEEERPGAALAADAGLRF